MGRQMMSPQMHLRAKCAKLLLRWDRCFAFESLGVSGGFWYRSNLWIPMKSYEWIEVMVGNGRQVESERLIFGFR